MSDFLSRLVREKPLGAFGGIIVLLLLFTGIFADVLAPFPMSEPHMFDRLTGPSGKYLLGTDQLGRDVLSRIIYGARVSLVVGLAATSVNMVVALLIGTTTGFFGGKLDMVVQRFVDAWMAFPGLLILITVMSCWSAKACCRPYWCWVLPASLAARGFRAQCRHRHQARTCICRPPKRLARARPEPSSVTDFPHCGRGYGEQQRRVLPAGRNRGAGLMPEVRPSR